MRVLVATTAGAGHFGPLLPFAVSWREAGHEVAVAAPESFASTIERSGFVHHPFADAPEEELRTVWATLPGMSNDEANAVVVREVFGRIDARAALPGLQAAVNRWLPDVIVRETSEFASYIVAEARGIPHVQVAVGLTSFTERFLPVVEDPLTELGAGGLAGLRSAPRLTLLPESFEGPAGHPAQRTRRFRDDASANGDPLPDWWPGSQGPLVYVTFGSVAAGLGLFPDFYQAIVAALGDLPVRVLLTTGDVANPEELGPVPGNVHVERWWPQQEVMADAAAMVNHGGFGTTLLGLAAGVPMVVVPMFADQPDNARRVEATGAGIALGGGPAAVGKLPGAVRRVLDQASYGMAARRLADEVARLPPTADSVQVLEEVATGRRP